MERLQYRRGQIGTGGRGTNGGQVEGAQPGGHVGYGGVGDQDDLSDSHASVQTEK